MSFSIKYLDKPFNALRKTLRTRRRSIMKSDPLKVLYKALNGNILVKLKDGREFAGKLVRTDDTMNMILVEASEVADGGGTQVANYGKLLVRGNNILYVKTDFNRY